VTVIELGFVTDDGDQRPAPGERRARDRRVIRNVLVAVVAAFCVLTVTGSARPDPRGLPQLWSVPYREGADTFTVNGDALYLLTTVGDTTLTAYDLRTGATRWSRGALADTTSLGSVEGGVLLLPAGYTAARYEDEDGTEISREFSRETVAVDTATGRQLWRHAGEFNVATGDVALLTEWNDEGSKVRTLWVVRLSDGSPVWSRPAGNLDSWVTDWLDRSSAGLLVTAAPEGRVEVLNFADGTLVTSGLLPWGRQPPEVDEYTSVTLDGRRLYLDHTRQDQSTTTAYDTGTLRQLWQIERQSSGGGAYSCGPVVCLHSVTEVAGYDRDTGELRWRIPGRTNGYPLPGGQLLVDDDESGTRHHLVDGKTGRPLADLGAAVPVWSLGEEASPYLVAHTREPAGFMSVSRFDNRSGEVLMRGTTVPVLDYSCQSVGSLLACVTMDRQLIVTDVG
jgi:outer membrane protein assembly factor BamB